MRPRRCCDPLGAPASLGHPRRGPRSLRAIAANFPTAGWLDERGAPYSAETVAFVQAESRDAAARLVKITCILFPGDSVEIMECLPLPAP